MSYFDVRKLTQEENKETDFLKINLMFEVLPWDQFSSELSQIEQSMLDYSDGCCPYHSSKGQLFINSVISHAYDAADAMDTHKFATVLEINAIFLSFAQMSTKKATVINHLVVAKKGVFHQRKP